MPSEQIQKLAQEYWNEAKAIGRKDYGMDDPDYVLSLVRQRPGVRRRVFREVERIHQEECRQ